MLYTVFETANCGKVVVVGYKNRDDITVAFANTGHVIKTNKDTLTGSDKPRLRDPLARTVFGVGCVGVGPHKAHHKGADTKPFAIWRAMLRRCYYLPERTAWREDCSVAGEWHNYQTFAAWYEEEYPRDGGKYQLDKDTLYQGNKVYSPHTCQFITQAANLAARRYKRDRPHATPQK